MVRIRGLAFILSLLQLTSYCQETHVVPDIPQIQTADFVGANVAWVVTDRGVILYTNDSGKTWSKRAFNTTARLQHLSFVDTRLGWAVDEEAQIWLTADGGATWLLKSKLDYSHFPFVGPIEQIEFVDALHGWIVDPFSIWRTEDGGTNWQRHVPLAGTKRLKEPTHRCFFINRKTGWLCGEGGVVYRSDDGGKTWQEQTVTTRKEVVIAAVYFLDEGIGWACGWPSGGIYYTNDGGKTWHQQFALAKLTVIDCIHFINEKEGWAVGSGGTDSPDHHMGIILRTRDGGQTWRYAWVNDGDSSFDRVFFSDGRRGWVTARNSIYQTGDGGKTWRRILRVRDRAMNR